MPKIEQQYTYNSVKNFKQIKIKPDMEAIVVKSEHAVQTVILTEITARYIKQEMYPSLKGF